MARSWTNVEYTYNTVIEAFLESHIPLTSFVNAFHVRRSSYRCTDGNIVRYTNKSLNEGLFAVGSEVKVRFAEKEDSNGDVWEIREILGLAKNFSK